MDRQQQVSATSVLSVAQPSRRAGRREPLLLGLCVGLLLLAVVPPLINLGRFQRRIAGAISRSVGRPVSMDAVSLRLLPWPALQITNLVVEEEPGFGAEPALTAPEVIAEPRLSSLWRGRFELSRVELSDASVNLVRAPDGRWNISSVLFQASQIANAPTAQSRPGPAPRFPYIEATGTRINLKRGVEKLPYSLLNADFSMFLSRPELWQLKLQGQPVRTDLDLSSGDTGLLRVEGQLHRLPPDLSAASTGARSSLNSMPLALDAEWSHAPLGQLSRLLLGRDAGWRGDIDVTGRFQGDMDHLLVRTHLLVANLHRQEFTPEQAFTLDATCRGTYSHPSESISGLLCRWPVGNGSLVLRQDGTGAQSVLALGADKVPASFLDAALGLVGQGVPPPQELEGELNGLLALDLGSRQLTGSLAAPSVVLRHAGVDGSPLVLQHLQLLPGPGSDPGLLLVSEPVPMGVPGKPVRVSAELSRKGYTISVDGMGALAPVQAAAAALHLPGAAAFSQSPGLPAAPPAVLEFALTSSGRWSVSDLLLGPAVNTAGTVHLENVLWRAPWLPVPVRFAALDATVSPGLIRWASPSATVGEGGARLQLSGDAQILLTCVGELPCATHFTLEAASLDAASVQNALRSSDQPLLSALLHRLDSSRTPLPALTGTIHADTLLLGRLPVHDASILVSTANTSTTIATAPAAAIKSLDGRALGGRLHMAGSVAFAGGSPRYTLEASLSGGSAAQAAALWHESWGPGILSGTAEFSIAGATTKELLASASGKFQVSWLHGSLAPALPRFAGWDAEGTLGPDGLFIEHGALPGTTADLAGRIGWDRALSMQLTPAPELPPQVLSGSLAAPALTTAPPAQASPPRAQ